MVRATFRIREKFTSEIEKLSQLLLEMFSLIKLKVSKREVQSC